MKPHPLPMPLPRPLAKTGSDLVHPPSPGHEKAVVNIRRLIWLYFALLLLEGALRKWVLPRFSDPLLIIRDPVLIMIYILAFRAKCFPRNNYIVALGIIAALCWIVSILVLQPYLPFETVILITGYGFRSNFFHLPLIFVIASVFDIEDVKRTGWWVIILMIPMALLLALQFQASPESFINRTAGLGEGQQIHAGGGKIRPPGTFSFVSGPIFYVSVAAAYVLYGALTRFSYKTWLVIASGIAVVIAVAVSGSRSCVASVLLVVFSLVIILVVRPDAVNKFGRNLLIAVVAAVIISRLPIFKEGIGILSDRFVSSAEAAETSIIGGMIERTLSGFTEGLRVLNRMPLSGYGLGVGTMGGAHFLVGHSVFLLAEGEWSRILLESGPILGLAFLVWRTVLTAKLGLLSLRSLKRGEILPILLFSVGFVALLNGQFGQPTNLGFAVVLNGLCLAATLPRRPGAIEPVSGNGLKPDAISKRLPRRSEYASRLHTQVAGIPQRDGFADR
jgi:hypothetical protein